MDAVTDRRAVLPAVLTALLDPVRDPAVYRAAVCFLLLVPLGIVGWFWVVTTLALGAALSVTLVGIPIIAASLVGSRWLGGLARQLARWGVAAKVAEPGALVRGPGLVGWLKGAFIDPVNWRTALYLVLMLPFGLAAGFVTVMLGAMAVFTPVILVAPWIIRGLAAANRWLAERLLAPVTLSERVQRLQNSRRQVMDTAAAERRRIERDLHDGAQARLVALAMDLGMAKDRLSRGEGPEQVATMVAAAHDELKVALQELRGLARGIHPAVLTDRGLDAALSAVAARCTVPVTVTVDLPERPPPAIEQIAYFCASELLTNVSKHSQARHAAADVERSSELLVIEIRDDGVGGADPAAGSGLGGLAERVAGAGGQLTVDSPAGGPTIVRVELPCGS